MKTQAILRAAAAAPYLGISRTTLWRLSENDKTFPSKIHLTSRCVGWRKSDLDSWITSRVGV
jgi:predicted DNA-binding transcriptional regulator AlpA